MMSTQIPNHKAQSMSITEYAEDLARSGAQNLPGGSETFWARYESGAMMRIPVFHLEPPASNEVQRVLWYGWAATARSWRPGLLRHPPDGTERWDT